MRAALGNLDKNSLDLENRGAKHVSISKPAERYENQLSLEAAKIIILQQKHQIQALQMQLAFYRMKNSSTGVTSAPTPSTTTPKKRKIDNNTENTSTTPHDAPFTPQRVKWRDIPAAPELSTPTRNRRSSCDSSTAPPSTSAKCNTPPEVDASASKSDDDVSTLVDRLHVLEESVKKLYLAPAGENVTSSTPPSTTSNPTINGSSVLEEKEEVATIHTPVLESGRGSPAVASFHHTLATRYDKDYKHDSVSYYNMKNLYQPTLSPLGDQGPGPSKVALSSLSNLQSKMSTWRSKYTINNAGQT